MGTNGWLLALADEWMTPADIALPRESTSPGLDAGLAELLAGNTGKAAARFEHELAAARERKDPRVGMLAAKLSWTAETRSFNLLPNAAGTGALDVQLRWSGPTRARQFYEIASEMRTWGPSGISVAGRWLDFVSGTTSAAASLRAGRTESTIRDALLTMFRNQLDSARSDASDVGETAPGFVDRALSHLLYQAGKPDEARGVLETALASARATGDAYGALSSRALATDWALCMCSSALVGNLEIDDAAWPSSELAFNIEAAEGITSGDIASAAATFASLVTEADGIGAARCAAALVLRQAFATGQIGDHSTQVALCQDACRRFEALGDVMHGHLARVHHLLARLEAGQPLEDVEVARAIGAWGRTAGSFSYTLGLGLLITRSARFALLREGDYERAEAAFRMALALNEGLGAELRTAQSCADLGTVHRVLGNRDRTRMYFERSMEHLDAVSKQVDHPLIQQRIALLTYELFNEANAYRDVAGMKTAARRVAAIAGLGTDPAGLAVSELVQGMATDVAVLVPLYSAMELQRAGDDEAAEPELARAREAARAAPRSDIPFSAIVECAARRYEDALRDYDAFLAAGGMAQGLVGGLLARNESTRDFHARETAAATLRQAQADLSFLLRLKAFERAEQAHATIVRLAGADWWQADPTPWQPLADIAEMHEGCKRPELATQFYRIAIDELERRRSRLSRDELKTAFASNAGAQYVYFHATRLELELAMGGDRARLANAFTLSERGRARALLDLVTSQLRQPAHGAEPAALARWRRLTTQSQVWAGLLATARSSQQPDADARARDIESKLGRIDEDLHRATNDLATELPQFGELLQWDAPVIALDALCGLLPADTAMLDYMTFGDYLLRWCVTREGISCEDIVPRRAATLARKIRELHELCAHVGDETKLRALAEELSSELLTPFDSVIAKHSNLVLVPYGELNRLPFAALRWRNEWLGAQKRLTTVPSATVYGTLRRTSRPAATHNRLLAVGAPDQMSHVPPLETAAVPLQQLPGTSAEARCIAELFHASPLLAAEATLPRVLAALPACNLVHFATHGLLYREAPLLSGVALAFGERLTVQDLLAMRFEPDLVTLSACHTGLGTLTAGEEILGLSRGLIAAGARCIIVSLWPVSDDATAALMVELYEKLHAGMEPSAAMQEAQRHVRGLDVASFGAARRDFDEDDEPPPADVTATAEHPFYWAPFVIAGVWRDVPGFSG